MSDPNRSGKKGRSLLTEVFGKIPLPEKVCSFDPSYNSYWDERIAHDVFTIPARRKAKGISSFIGKGDSVLDIGCGTGETLEYLRSVNDIRGTGLDISDKALEIVAAKGFSTLNTDLTISTNQLDTQFDHIIIFEVIEHVPDAETLLLKAKGHYRKGLYVSSPNIGYIGHRLRMAFGRFPVTYLSDPREHLRFWTVRDFLDWSEWLGFRKPEVIGTRGKVKFFGAPSRWPSFWASEVIYRFLPE